MMMKWWSECLVLLCINQYADILVYEIIYRDCFFRHMILPTFPVTTKYGLFIIFIFNEVRNSTFGD